jgi:hypothetical protein
MAEVHFHIKDRRNETCREEIKSTLSGIGAIEVNKAVEANVLIAHGNTDGPGNEGGLEAETINRCIELGGLYLNYTTDSRNWDLQKPGEYSGGHRELIQLLSFTSAPISINDLRKALEIGPKLEELQSLLILCQGYLVAHFPQPSEAPEIIKQALAMMEWTKLVETEIGKKFANIAHSNAGQTENPHWWRKVFYTDKKYLLKTLGKEWGKERLPKEISNLVTAIFGRSNIKVRKASFVAQAYIKIAERLNGGIS